MFSDVKPYCKKIQTINWLLSRTERASIHLLLAIPRERTIRRGRRVGMDGVGRGSNGKRTKRTWSPGHGGVVVVIVEVDKVEKWRGLGVAI